MKGVEMQIAEDQMLMSYVYKIYVWINGIKV